MQLQTHEYGYLSKVKRKEVVVIIDRLVREHKAQPKFDIHKQVTRDWINTRAILLKQALDDLESLRVQSELLAEAASTQVLPLQDQEQEAAVAEYQRRSQTLIHLANPFKHDKIVVRHLGDVAGIPETIAGASAIYKAN